MASSELDSMLEEGEDLDASLFRLGIEYAGGPEEAQWLERWRGLAVFV